MDISFRNAFTLLQLIIVVVVLGILAGISIPQYTKLKERTFAKEAIANLKLIATAERVYYDENGGYRACDCIISGITGCNADATGCNKVLKLDLNPSNWKYYVILDGGGFNITANRQISGRLCSYTFNDVDGEPTKGAYCP